MSVIPPVQLLAKKNFPDVTLWQRGISLEYMPLELKETFLFKFFHALCVCFSLLLLLALLHIRLVNVRQVFVDVQKLEHVKVAIWAHRAAIYGAEIRLCCNKQVLIASAVVIIIRHRKRWDNMIAVLYFVPQSCVEHYTLSRDNLCYSVANFVVKVHSLHSIIVCHNFLIFYRFYNIGFNIISRCPL